MSAPIVVPDHLPRFKEMQSTPERAETFATNLRAVTVGVKNAHSDVGNLAAPEWLGASKAAHDHAASRFTHRIDVIDAALDRAVVASDRFEERISRLWRQRGPIETERVRVNHACAALRQDIAATADHSRDEEFRRRARHLRGRAADVSERIERWITRHDDAESDFIRALRGVDTVQEGRRAARSPDRPDVGALHRRFGSLAGDPRALAAWWARLSRAERDALTTEFPGLVGNAGGIPSRDRDEANRAALYNDIDYLSQRDRDGEITDHERDVLDNAKAVRAQLDKYQPFVDPTTGHELGYVLVYKPGAHSGDGGVAIAFGDPDRADHVAAFVPGFSSDTQGIGTYLNDMMDLRDQALMDHDGTVSTMLWLDYDAPSGHLGSPSDVYDLANVVSPARAMQGGQAFSHFIDGLHASDQGAPAHVTAIGHSYGSTTVGWALHDGMKVDDAVLIGSPGQPALSAHGLTDAHVWVGSMDNDPVSLLGLDGRPDHGGFTATLGADPAQSSFGGTRFDTGDGSLRLGDLLHNHSSYFQGHSMDNMAHIVAGADGQVTTEDPRNGLNYQTLPELLATASANSAAHDLWDAVTSVPKGLEQLADPRRWVP